MKLLLRQFILAFVILLIPTAQTGTILAYTQFQLDAINEGRPLYDPNECDPDADNDTSTASNVATGTYVAVGNIPIGGKEVGSSTFGGSYASGKWTAHNGQQGSIPPVDDTGIGVQDIRLPGQTAYAELSLNASSKDYSALGNLPVHTKLEISYNGKKIIAEKLDVGAGGPDVDGKPRAIDLWWETAKLLGFTGGTGVVTIHAVSAETPVTPIDGAASVTTATSSAEVVKCCQKLDEATGPLNGSDNQEKAFNYFVGKGFTAIQAAGIVGNLVQESGVDPHSIQGNGGPGRGIAQWTVTDRWATLLKFAAASGRDPWTLEVQLDFITKEFAGSFKKAYTALKAATTLPAAVHAYEAYYEICGKCDSDSRLKYANVVLTLYGNSSTAVPGPTTATDTSGGCSTAAGGVVSGSIVKTAVGLAWPNPTGKNPDHDFKTPTPAYKTAWNGSSDYTDCGAFVSTVMTKSGADPKYPEVGTGSQLAYVKSHIDKYIIIEHPTSTAQLRPGDIMVFDGHTSFWVGPQAGGYTVAEASLGEHTPSLDTTGNATWMFGQPGIVVARLR